MEVIPTILSISLYCLPNSSSVPTYATIDDVSIFPLSKINLCSKDPSTMNCDLINVPSKTWIGAATDPKLAVATPLLTVVFAVIVSEIENTISESFDLPTHTRPGCKTIWVLVLLAVTLNEIDALAAVFERGT